MKRFTLSRRGFVQGAVALAATPSTLAAQAQGTPAAGSLAPLPAVSAIFDASDHFPLIALGEHHQLQDFHDLLSALVFHPAFPDNVNDVVVEFGNSLYQEVVDRFVVNGEPVANAELEQIWRDTIGGGVIWDAPVYGQFFRNMRAINWMLPPERRVRVVLGDPPIDFAKIKSASDAAAVPTEDSRDTFYAGVVASEVLAKGRRGLLVAGYPHLRHGLHPTRSANQLNAVTLLDQQHPKSVFTIETLPVNPGWMPDDAIQQIVTEFVAWTAPSVAKIAGTWLGQVAASVRAVDPNATLEAQVDAVLWLGPNTRLTASRADPAVYQCGDYATELARRSTVLNEIQGSQGRPVDMVADGLLAARAPANWP